MPFCTYCGAANENSFRFCSHCGRGAASAVVVQPPAIASIGRPGYPTAAAQSYNAAQFETDEINYRAWLQRNKLWLLLLPAIALLALAMYLFFWKKDPAQEALALAAKECACAQRRVEDEIRQKRSFLVNFENYKFTDAEAAQEGYNALQASLNAATDSCASANRTVYNELVAGFKNPQQFALFEERYAATINHCGVQGAGIADLDAKAKQLILGFGQKQDAQQSNKGRQDYQRMMDGVMRDVLPQQANLSTGSIAFSDIIAGLYAAENAIQKQSDIDAALDYFEYPVLQYYNEYNVDRTKMAAIYEETYLKKLRKHKAFFYEKSTRSETLPNGDTKLTIGRHFEFATLQSPKRLRTTAATNVYTLSPGGKIKSLY